METEEKSISKEEIDYYNQKRNNQEHNYKIKNW